MYDLYTLRSCYVTMSRFIETMHAYMQVFTVGQRVTFEFHGTNYILTVDQAVVEADWNKKNGIERGMICNDTYFVFEASNASGIKVCFLINSFGCLIT